jgi:hypothetical protein
MKLTMIGILSAVAGTAAAVIVVNVDTHLKEKERDSMILQSLMYAQPLQQQDFDVAQSLPADALPADATPTPGIKAEQGSARPTIGIKSGGFLQPSPIKAMSKLVLSKTNEIVEGTKDPVWSLQLVKDGKVIDKIPALTGRASKQSLNRHTSGNKSPLPIGAYYINQTAIERGPFSDPELGSGYWIPFTPMFQTNRSDLGFHQDPSWGRKNGESGTSGCIGLQSAKETAKLVEWIKKYNIHWLVVES